ncbi:hypothetical protein ABZ826_26725 [Streptomyces sp. NPDC047515]|uniref:hypothetical protein n=1 Tax=Streptomyces sp. NPDC047515 TaxID=3155380 RepID=UPI0033CCA867
MSQLRAAAKTWVRLLTRPGAPQLVDTVLVRTSEERASGVPGTDLPPPSAEQRIECFRSSFSPEAYRLVVRLSAIRPLSMPVIQLIRIATLPATTSAVVAEVLLGELLQPVTADGAAGQPLSAAAVLGGTGEVLYDFRPGVRDLLAGGLDTEQSIEVVEAVGRALEPYLGRMPDFAALLADPGGSARLSPGTTAFAVLVSPLLDRLYGGGRRPRKRWRRRTRLTSCPNCPPYPCCSRCSGPNWRDGAMNRSPWGLRSSRPF